MSHLKLLQLVTLHTKRASVHTYRSETARQHWGSQVSPRLWVLITDFAACHPSAAENLKLVPRVVGNLRILASNNET